jgi:hypothetical protein
LKLKLLLIELLDKVLLEDQESKLTLKHQELPEIKSSGDQE